MSLQDIYEQRYAPSFVEGSKIASEEEFAKVASEIEGIIVDIGYTEEEASKLASACEYLDQSEVVFEDYLQKLAAASELVDEVDAESDCDEDEKLASDYDAAGRIMAQSFIDEINKNAADDTEHEDDDDKKKNMKGKMMAYMNGKKDDKKEDKEEKKEKEATAFDRAFANLIS